MTENDTSDEHDPAEERCQIELDPSPSSGGTDLYRLEAEALSEESALALKRRIEDDSNLTLTAFESALQPGTEDDCDV